MTAETLLTGNAEQSVSDDGQSQETTTTTTTETTTEASWRDSLPDELKNNVSLEKFKDLNALATGYISAESMIGKDKVVVPSKHSTEEDWKNFYKSVGMPGAEEYVVEGMDAEKATEFDKQLKDLLVNNNILPKQAKELYKFIQDSTASDKTKAEETYKTHLEEGINDLKKEWGDAFDNNLNAARAAFSTYADENMVEYMINSGMGNDPVILKIFAEVGKNLGEHQFKGNANNGPVTPADAQRKIDTIMDNPEHPYNIVGHAGHDAATKEVEELFKSLTPVK